MARQSNNPKTEAPAATEITEAAGIAETAEVTETAEITETAGNEAPETQGDPEGDTDAPIEITRRVEIVLTGASSFTGKGVVRAKKDVPFFIDIAKAETLLATGLFARAH
jgi:hypothetical protein